MILRPAEKKGSSVDPTNLLIISFFLWGLIISCNRDSSKNENSKTVVVADEDADRDSTYVVDVVAADYAFGMPSQIPSGWITFRMQNMGEEVHHGVIAKFVDSLSYQDLAQMIGRAIAESTSEAYDPIYAVMEKDYGGPAMLSPGLTGETTVFLEPGLYSLSCHLRTPEGAYHMDKGMHRPFVVTNQKAGTGKPDTNVELTLSNFSIDVGPVAAGEQIFNVKYDDYDYHNVHLARLQDDQKIEDLKIWMTRAQTPSPFQFLGGAEQVPEGKSATFKATLEPGRYAFVAFGQAIAGMVAEIKVPAEGKSVPIKNNNINKEVRINLNLNKTQYPQQVPTGRTPIIIKNTGNKKYRYILAILKEGYSREDFEKYLFNVANEEVAPEEKNIPSFPVWENNLSPGEEEKFSLQVEEKSYILVGPLVSGQSLKSQWRVENLIHFFKGANSTEY